VTEPHTAKIYVFVNARWGTGDVIGVALAEDGHCLASHICSSESFVPHDLGATSTWKHDHYREHFPDGFDVVYVPSDQVADHAGIAAAAKLNKQLEEESSD